ncbi:MAG: hypothetical protein KME21_15205 [Desmonostoc vinosum HA7617-LM4]|jgi:hypothetical protein|nr:hypothetical protein [Desmonostoc vinosum HA7617-LM4]
MLNSNQNLRIKIIGGVFAVINLGLISLGLVSCGGEDKEKQRLAPTEQQRPVQQPNRQDDDDQEDDEEDGQDDKD